MFELSTSPSIAIFPKLVIGSLPINCLSNGIEINVTWLIDEVPISINITIKVYLIFFILILAVYFEPTVMNPNYENHILIV